MNHYDTGNDATTGNDDGMWLVRMTDGGVRAMSLEELDDAFQRDLISGETEVLQEGATEWMRLRDLIGGDEQPEPVAPADAGVANPAVASPAIASPGVASPTIVPPMNPGAALAPSSFPHSAYPQDAQPLARPVPAWQAPAGASPLMAPNSTAPVASSIDDDDLDFSDMAFRKKRGRGRYVVGALLLVAGAGAFLFRNQLTSSDTITPEAALQTMAAPAAAPPTPEPTQTAQPSADSRLSDETKRALAERDKQREKAELEKQKALRDKRQAAPSRRSGGKRSSVFSKTGDRYDPLNAGL